MNRKNERGPGPSKLMQKNPPITEIIETTLLHLFE